MVKYQHQRKLEKELFCALSTNIPGSGDSNFHKKEKEVTGVAQLTGQCPSLVSELHRAVGSPLSSISFCTEITTLTKAAPESQDVNILSLPFYVYMKIYTAPSTSHQREELALLFAEKWPSGDRSDTREKHH